MLGAPPEAPAAEPDAAAGLRVQHTVAQLALREAGLTSRSDPLVVTPAEANAFLQRHFHMADPPVWPLRVGLEAGAVEVAGPSTVGRLVERGGFGPLGTAIPAGLWGRPVWLTLRGRLVVRPGRGELVPDAARVGRQPVPVPWLWTLAGGRPPSLTWTMPRVVERIEVTTDGLVIHTRPRGAPGGRPP
jgi:hypothetical protein